MNKRIISRNALNTSVMTMGCSRMEGKWVKNKADVT